MEPTTATSRKDIAIIEDELTTREGLQMLISGTTPYTCHAYPGVEEALRAFRERAPDLVLMDLGLQGMSGLDGIRLISDEWPELPVLVLTIFDDEARIFDALSAGARGYLVKTATPAHILSGIDEVLAGGAPISPELARRVVAAFRTLSPANRGHDYRLTPAELGVLTLLSRGLSYRGAAAELSLSPNTVAFHVKNIYQKLQVTSKVGAVTKALTEGLCPVASPAEATAKPPRVDR